MNDKKEIIEELYNVMKKHNIGFVVPSNADRTIALCIGGYENEPSVLEFKEEFTTFDMEGFGHELSHSRVDDWEDKGIFGSNWND